MYVTMENYPEVFPYIYVNMIKVGELSGSLTNSLGQAVKYIDNSEGIKKKLRSILIPNIIQFVLLIVMLVAGTLFAIPQIQNLFETMGSNEQLPALTLWFSGVITAIMNIWYIPTLMLIGAIVVLYLYINTPKGRYRFHYFKYTAPIFGKLIYLLDLSRFLKAVLLNIQNGMRIQDAIEVSKNVVQNYVMLSVIEIARNNILIGKSWIEPFEQANLSATMAIEMLKIGMQTDLSEMMEKIVEYMDIDIDNTIQKIIKVLPQVVYSIVGILIIFFVLVVLVPVIQVYMGTFLFSAAGV